MNNPKGYVDALEGALETLVERQEDVLADIDAFLQESGMKPEMLQLCQEAASLGSTIELLNDTSRKEVHDWRRRLWAKACFRAVELNSSVIARFSAEAEIQFGSHVWLRYKGPHMLIADIKYWLASEGDLK